MIRLTMQSYDLWQTTRFYKQRGSMSQSGQKAQKYVSDLTEKYMKDMNKLVR